MIGNQIVSSLKKLERYFQWIAIPNIAILFVTLQAFGFVFVMMDPIWIERLALIPDLVWQGQLWRLVTFLALPSTDSPIWIVFTLWFIYFVLNTIEEQWGAFKTTLYVLVSIIVTVTFSLVFDYPITQVADFESTLFLAAASLFPEFEVLLYFILPVKMKWLGLVSLAYLAYRLVLASWLSRFYLLSIYSNYFIFFGPALLGQIKQAIRRYQYRKKMGR